MTEATKKVQRWSYSRVGSFKTCPRLYELQYIHKVRGEDNAFSQYGQMVHEILEKYAMGELKLKDLLGAYDDGFSTMVTKQFPESFMDLAMKYYKDGEKFFKGFTGFKDETIAIETRLDFIIKRPDGIDDINFVGIIDRLSKDGEFYVINDYKSKGRFKSKQEQADYFKQLYMYAIVYKEQAGIADDKMWLKLNLFRLQQEFKEEYDSVKAEQVKKDFIDMVDLINRTTDYPPKTDRFFCTNLCGMGAMDCEFKDIKTWESK
jgi:ATP-dependent exoDNAse (exonuclease V) beta subunit